VVEAPALLGEQRAVPDLLRPGGQYLLEKRRLVCGGYVPVVAD
jgi:hypothetical protein